ncbi:MAG: hypothetical protein AAF431_03845 [Pseudomonadota bacterium]
MTKSSGAQCFGIAPPNSVFFKRTGCAAEYEVLPISHKFDAPASGLTLSYIGSRTLPTVRLLGPDGLAMELDIRQIGSQLNHRLVRLQDDMIGRTVQLSVSTDDDSQWVLISAPQNKDFLGQAGVNLFVILMMIVVIHVLMLSLWSALSSRYGQVKSMLLLPMLLGALGYLSFWAYYVDRSLGISVTLFAGLIAGFGLWHIAKNGFKHALLANMLLLPISAYTLFVIAVSYFPYLQNLAEDSFQSANRWREMPIDAYIPRIFANRIWHDQSLATFIAGWLSSDRPPLQTGINLLFYPLMNSGMAYQLISSYLQAMVILPLLFLFRKLVGSQHVFWPMLGLLMTGFMASNTLFVWPKLISAMFLLICYIVLLNDEELRLSQKEKVLFSGSAGAMAMLCHGGAIFGLLPIYAWCLWRGFHYVKQVVIPSGLFMIVTYTPWILYQKLLDPPGDRLVKWHLAGHPAITDKPFSQVLMEAYAKLTPGEWIANRLANFDVIFDRTWQIVYWLPEMLKVPFHQPFYQFLQDITFGNFFFSFWFYSPLYALLFFGAATVRRSREGPPIKTLASISILGLLLWTVLMYLPKATSIHQGTYFLWLTFFLIAYGLMSRAHFIYPVIAALLNTVLFFQFYVLDFVYLARNGHTEYLYMVGISFLLLITSLIVLSRRFDLVPDR